jgi:hypothetical protein
MIHRRCQDTPVPPIASPRVRTVRLLEDPAELHAAVARAREFERRVFDEYQRRVGSYDRYLRPGENPAAEVVAIASPSALVHEHDRIDGHVHHGETAVPENGIDGKVPDTLSA